MPFLPQPGAPLLTPRLELRVPSVADLPAIHELHADPRTFEHDSTPLVTSRDRMERVLAAWTADRDRQGFGYATVRPRERRRPSSPAAASAAAALPGDLADPTLLLGVCGLTRYRLRDRVVLSAYYRFRPEAWGRGIASEALGAVLAQADRALPGAEAVIITDRGNAPSRALAERTGFGLTAETVPDEPGLIVLARPLGPEAAR